MAKENNTGIIRGIDNLGRVVLPKELSRPCGPEREGGASDHVYPAL